MDGRARGWILVGLALLPGCGGGTKGKPPADGGGSAPVAPLPVARQSVGGAIELPEPLRVRVAAVATVDGSVVLRPDGGFDGLPGFQGSTPYVAYALDAGGDALFPFVVDGADVRCDATAVVGGLALHTPWGLGVPAPDRRAFLAALAADTGHAAVVVDLGIAAAQGVALLDPAAGPLVERVVEVAARAFDAFAAAAVGAASAPVRPAAPAADCGGPVLEPGTVGFEVRSDAGTCALHAVNPSAAFYGVSMYEASNGAWRELLDRATFVRPVETPIDLSRLALGDWSPPEPRTTVLRTGGLPDGSYRVVAHKTLLDVEPGDGALPAGALLGSAGNAVYFLSIVLDLLVAVLPEPGILAAVAPLLRVGEEEAVADLLEVLAPEGSPPDDCDDPASAGDAVRCLLEELQDAAAESVERLFERLVASPGTASRIAKVLYHVAPTLGSAVTWKQAMQAGWKVLKAIRVAVAVFDTVTRYGPFLYDLMLGPRRASAEFRVEGGVVTLTGATGDVAPLPCVFVVRPSTPVPGERVWFRAVPRTVLQPGSVTCRWDFGDGSAVESGEDLLEREHVFPRAGSYEVRLTFVHGGREASFRRTVFVAPARRAHLGVVEVSVGADPGRAHLEDLDGDGDLDALVPLRGRHEVAVLRGRGAGLFEPDHTLDLVAPPAAVVVGDLGPGGARTVAVLLAGGAGIERFAVGPGLTFAPSGPLLPVPGLGAPEDLAVGRFHGDVTEDLVLADTPADVVWIWRSDGGTFAPEAATPYAVDDAPWRLLVADLDADTDPDLVVANRAGDTLSVLERQGPGVLVVTQRRLPSGAVTYGGPEHLAFGDVVAEPGRTPEVVVTNGRGGSVSVFRRAPGAGPLALEPAAPDWVVGGSPGPLVLVDLDRDGDAEVVQLDPVAGELRVFDAGGVWPPPAATERPRVQVGTGAAALACAVEPADGRRVLATSNPPVQTLSSVLVGSDGVLEARVDFATTDGPELDEAYDVVVADLFPGGGQDVAIVTRNTDQLVLYRSTGDARLLERMQRLPTGGEPLSVAAGDLDGDGDLELAVACNDDDSVHVFARDAAGTYAEVAALAASAEPLRVAIADLVPGGGCELVVGHYASDVVAVWAWEPAASPPLVLRGTYGSPHLHAMHGMSVGDVDGDGALDVISASYFGSAVALLFGDGGALTSGADPLPVGGPPTAVLAQDVDGDGDADVVVAGAGGGMVFRGDRSRDLGAGLPFDPGHFGLNNFTRIAAGHADGDGLLDLFVQDSSEFGDASRPGRHTVALLHGDGTGRFGARVAYLMAPFPAAVAVGDVDGDGEPDVVTTSRSGRSSAAGGVSVLRRRRPVLTR